MSPELPGRRRRRAAKKDEPTAEVEAQESTADEAEAEESKGEGGQAEPAAAQAEEGAASPAAGEEAEEVEAKRPARRRASATASKAAAAPEEGESSEPAAQASDEQPAAKAPARRRRSTKSGTETSEAKTPAPQTQARRRPHGAPAVSVSAKARYVRTSPRKARMVCGHIRGKSVHEARAILEYTPRSVARDWSKLLESAIANAEHNHELLADDLVVREAFADAGPTIKRFRPRAMGRATPIRKRTSHLTITLSTGR